MKQLILVILIDHPGNFLQILLPEAKAKEICNNWLSGYYKLKDIARIGDANHAGGAWGVEVNKIVAMHTVDPAQMPQAGGLVSPSNPWRGGSGLNN